MSWPRKSPYDLLHGRQTFEHAGNPWDITLSQNSRVVAVIGEAVHSPARSALARTQHIRGMTYKGNQCAQDVVFVQPFLNSYHHHLPWSSRALVEGVGGHGLNRLWGHTDYQGRGGGAYSGNAQEEREKVRADTAPAFCSSCLLARSVGGGGGTHGRMRMGGRKGEGARVR